MTAPQRLLSFDDAAETLGVPKESLRRVADLHGMTIKIGRALRLHPDDLGELIDKCRVEARAQDSTGMRGQAGRQFGKSATLAEPKYRPAQIAAKRLKSLSRNTSTKSKDQVVQLRRTN